MAIPVGLLLTWVISRGKSPNNTVGWVGVHFYLIMIFHAALILPHELGHALMARAVGRRIFQVIVGSGPVLFKVPFLGGTLEVCAYPFGGMTRSLDPRLEGHRHRLWLTILGGPLVNLLLAAAIFPFLPKPFALIRLTQGWELTLTFFVANLVELFRNLIPRRFKMSQGLHPSDGLSLLKVPFLADEEVRKQASLYYLAFGSLDLNAQRFEAARLLYEEGLRHFPEAQTLKNDLAVAKLGMDDFAGAREDFLSLTMDPKTELPHRHLALSNVAASNLLLERSDLLPEADRCSQEAMASMAWIPAVRGTRAAVLVALGRFEEGIPMALEAMEAAAEPRKKAIHACTVARGCHGKGDSAEALKYLEIAERLDRSCRQLPKTRSLLGISSDPAGKTQ